MSWFCLIEFQLLIEQDGSNKARASEANWLGPNCGDFHHEKSRHDSTEPGVESIIKKRTKEQFVLAFLIEMQDSSLGLTPAMNPS